MRRMELERVALLSFLRRLLAAFGEREGAWAEGLLPRASADELDRLVRVALAAIQEEAKGRCGAHPRPPAPPSSGGRWSVPTTRPTYGTIPRSPTPRTTAR